MLRAHGRDGNVCFSIDRFAWDIPLAFTDYQDAYWSSVLDKWPYSELRLLEWCLFRIVSVGSTIEYHIVTVDMESVSLSITHSRFCMCARSFICACKM